MEEENCNYCNIIHSLEDSLSKTEHLLEEANNENAKLKEKIKDLEETIKAVQETAMQISKKKTNAYLYADSLEAQIKDLEHDKKVLEEELNKRR